MAVGAGVTILTVLAGVAIFLIVEAWPAITADSEDLPGGKSLISYIAPLAFGTCLAAVLAILIAVPLAIGVSLFISHYTPRWLAQPLGLVVDLLAAVPSIVYGLWGIAVLGPASVPLQKWLVEHLLDPLLRRSRDRDRPHDVRRGHRAGGDDPADHQRHLA